MTKVTDEVSVLLVEDDDGHADLVMWNLEKAGIQNPLYRVKNGQQALNFLLKQEEFMDAEIPSPDNLVMLLDINMPVMDGYEVIKFVRSHEGTRLLPIVMLTTAEDKREVTKCYELGCNLFMKKPIEHSELTSLIQQLGAILAPMRVPLAGGQS
ncbi:response regulator [Alteromonadaceae bacterium M269]|nr:response regulator [Alteromonadaceae bacterium M269]